MKTGKCGKPMWRMGMPAGFCCNESYGPGLHPKLTRYDGVIHSGWCCPIHGGPTKEEAEKHFQECGVCDNLFDKRVLFDVLQHEHNKSHYGMRYLDSPIGKPALQKPALMTTAKEEERG